MVSWRRPGGNHPLLIAQTVWHPGVMPDADPARHALYSRLESLLGQENADTLMTYLPSGRNEEVATKDDIATLETRFDRLESRFDRLESRFDRLESRFDRLESRFDGVDGRLAGMYETIIEQQKFYARTTVWSMVGLTAIFSLVVTLFG